MLIKLLHITILHTINNLISIIQVRVCHGVINVLIVLKNWPVFFTILPANTQVISKSGLCWTVDSDRREKLTVILVHRILITSYFSGDLWKRLFCYKCTMELTTENSCCVTQPRTSLQIYYNVAEPIKY